ncbi:MAG TPA: carbamate kinase [Nitrososphaerales archaeon]|nr:carbamate kinase [Nitrososphaerales archaeon]
MRISRVRNRRRNRRLKVLIALGGNAILRHGEKGTAEEQAASVRVTARNLVSMVEDGDRIAITHGNGPQVGDILLRNELAKTILPPMPLDVCGAESQGMIGYLLQQAMDEELRMKGLDTGVVTILTQTLVDSDDPAFNNPTKPIGAFYSASEAARLRTEKGWKMVEDSGRGYRRVVPSPIPKDIVEKDTIIRLFRSGTIVVAAGGGGVPVIRGQDGRLAGVEAVLDKDRTAALLAGILHTEVLLILTDVDGVYLDYLGPNRRMLTNLDIATCERYLNEGQFPPGSMGPKMESAVGFLKSGGKRAIITSLESAKKALAGRAGTTITLNLPHVAEW